MMKMLAEGGLPVITDQLRSADVDNPNGYFELEAVRQLKEGDVAWLQDADGKGVKVISSLLEYLPGDHRYKIIFMERESKETLASQRKMLDHRGEPTGMSDAEMEGQIRGHLAAVKPWLVRQPNMEVLFIKYNALIAEPDRFCEQIAEFVDLPLDQARMQAIPNVALYRNRISSRDEPS